MGQRQKDMEGLAGLELEVLGDILESPHEATPLGARGESPPH